MAMRRKIFLWGWRKVSIFDHYLTLTESLFTYMLKYIIPLVMVVCAPVAMSQSASDPLLAQARKAYLEYDFEQADELLDKLEAKLRRGRKEMPPEGRQLREETERAREMLDRVERIEIIDSVTVGRADFFRHIPLSPSVGRVGTPEELLPKGLSASGFTSVYSTADGQSFMWGTQGEGNHVRLMTADLLADGSTSPAVAVEGELASGGDVNFPFMLSDGVTLYYGATGDDSMGGYDIFMSRRGDGTSFLQPQNIGMPYNSPYDDFMLVIDDLTGAGWWATDRNHPGDSVTIYTFIPGELRQNYSPDTPGLGDLARVTSIAATRQPGKDYSAVRSAIAAAARETHHEDEAEFYFALPGGKVYTRFDQFRNSRAREIMHDLLSAQDQYDALEEELDALRRKYRDGDRGCGARILEGEARLDQLRQRLRSLSNDAVRTETANGL